MRVAFIAATCAALTAVAWNQYDHYVKRMESDRLLLQKVQDPATDWFVVRNLSVADGPANDTKLPVVYDREIKRPFVGRWYAEIKSAETQQTVCWGNGGALYEPKKVLPKAGVDLTWIMGKECFLSPQQYYLEINYRIAPQGYPEKEYRAVSNVFTVKGDSNG